MRWISLKLYPGNDHDLNKEAQLNKAYLSVLAGERLKKYIAESGYDVTLFNGECSTPPSPVYREILTHPDIHMCQIGSWENSHIFMGNTSDLGSNYPGNIIYNAVCTGKYFIHNLRYTSPALLEHVKSIYTDIITVNVRQGYTRCSCLPVDDASFITSDCGIARSLSDRDAEVLLISPGHISLPGFDYGFIGGCGGQMMTAGRRKLVFNGNLSSHPDFKKIAAFVEDRDIDVVYFEDYPLEDIGSLLVSCNDQ